MKTLFINETSELIGLAKKVTEAGFPTKTFIRSPLHSMAGLGFIDRTTSWRPEMKWADLIVSDATLTPAEQIALREWGRLLFGIGSIDTEAVEKILKKDEPVGGNLGDNDIVYWSYLSFWNGRTFTSPGFMVLTDWYLLAGDLGGLAEQPMGVTVFVYPQSDRVGAIDALLKGSNYRGPIEWQMVSSPEHTRAFSIRTGLNMTALSAIFEIIKMSPLDFMAEIAGGSLSDIPVHNLNAASTRLYGPPWPWRLPLGAQIKDSVLIHPGAEKHLYITDLWLGQEGETDDSKTPALFFGPSGSLGLATSAGKFGPKTKDPFREARRRVQRVVSGVHHPLLQYRSDSNDTAAESYEKLTSWKVI